MPASGRLWESHPSLGLVAVPEENLFVTGAITFFTSAPQATQHWGVTNYPNCLIFKMTL